MSQEPARRAHRIALQTAALIRGACGVFDAATADISLTGVRVRVTRAELRLDPSADLSDAAIVVQKRIGSRFAMELANTETGGRVRKRVELVRLVLPGTCPDGLDLGCMFARPLSMGEIDVLELTLPRSGEAGNAPVRAPLVREESSEPRYEPAAALEKVERLFDVPSQPPKVRGSARPMRALRAIVSAAGEQGAAPLVGTAAAFTESTVQVRIDAGWLDGVVSNGAHISEVASALIGSYGEWPEVEVAAGTQRRWRGSAHIYGLEFCDGPGTDVVVRMAFARRLGPEELSRLLAA